MPDTSDSHILNIFAGQASHEVMLRPNDVETLADFLRGSITSEDSDCVRDLRRLRLISTAIIAARLTGQQPPWLESLDQLIRKSAAILTEQPDPDENGVVLLKLEGWVVLQLPEVTVEGDVLPLLSSLSRIEHRYSGAEHWVIDLSGVQVSSPSLIAYLMGFQHGRNPGKRGSGAPSMSLLWLRAQTIPPSLLEATVRRFHLQHHGAFLLSHRKE